MEVRILKLCFHYYSETTMATVVKTEEDDEL